MPDSQHSTARIQQLYGYDGIINGKKIVDKAVREWVDEIVDWCRASLQELSYTLHRRKQWNQINQTSVRLQLNCVTVEYRIHGYAIHLY